MKIFIQADANFSLSQFFFFFLSCIVRFKDVLKLYALACYQFHRRDILEWIERYSKYILINQQATCMKTLSFYKSIYIIVSCFVALLCKLNVDFNAISKMLDLEEWVLTQGLTKTIPVETSIYSQKLSHREVII